MLLPMLTAEWLHLLHYRIYNNSRQNIIILVWKYLVNIRCEAWLNLFWEYTNGKLFALYAPLISFYIVIVICPADS
jgi:hypothetical protein